MTELIFKIWYRQQKLIDNINLFKGLFISIFLIGIFIVNIIIYSLLKIGSRVEVFIILNMLSLFLSQYNMPAIQKELKLEKVLSFYNKKYFYKYLIFLLLTKNFLIVILFLSMGINIVIFIVSDPILVVVMLMCICIQINIIILRFSDKKEKLIISLIIIGYGISIYFNIYSIALGIIIFNIYRYLNKIKSMCLDNINIKTFDNRKLKYLNNNHNVSIVTFMSRLKKGEYLDILMTVIVAIITYKFTNEKIVGYLIIFFFIAKFQLSLETQQMNYKKVYLKNIFLNTLNINSSKKIRNSVEFKIMILEFLTILIVLIFIINESKNYYLILWAINIALLLYLNLSKIMKVFYYYIDNKYYYKGTIINLVLFYIILFTTNIDTIVQYMKFNINDIHIELFKMIVIILFSIIKFENIFMIDSSRGKNEYEY